MTNAPQDQVFMKVLRPWKTKGILSHIPQCLSGIGKVCLISGIVGIAHENNMTLILTPSNYKGSSKKRLEDFYKRFDFVMNKGRTKDYSISELMYRKKIYK